MSETPLQIAFLASHGGSAMRFLCTAIDRGELDAEVAVVIVNNRDGVAFQWAQKRGLAVRHISGKTHPTPALEDAAICEALSNAGTNTVVLSGYMKRLGPSTLKAFTNKILNIHPSLLPKFGGKGMYGDRVHAAVLAAHETESGATVHLVDAHYDEGPVLGQVRVSVDPQDTVDTLRQKVQALEGPLYLEVLTRMSQTPTSQG